MNSVSSCACVADCVSAELDERATLGHRRECQEMSGISVQQWSLCSNTEISTLRTEIFPVCPRSIGKRNKHWVKNHRIVQFVRCFTMRLSHKTTQIFEALSSGCFRRVDETQRCEQLNRWIVSTTSSTHHVLPSLSCVPHQTRFRSCVCAGVQTL